jgi:predicted PurR-regulated permease PerM
MKNYNVIFLALVLISAIALISAIGGVLMPFIVSFVLAYLFVPFANKLENRFNIPRFAGSLFVIAMIICMFSALWLFLTPMIFKQIQLFIHEIPEYKLFFQLLLVL